MIAMTISLESLGWIALLLAASALSFVYSGLETGIYLMNKIRLDLLAESGSAPARRIRGVIANQGNFLAVLLLGANLANYATTFAISALFVLAGYRHAEWYTLAVGAPILFVFCESVPKNVAQRVAETMVLSLSGVLKASSVVFNACGLAPLVRGFAWLLMRIVAPKARSHATMGHESLSAVVAESHASGVLTHSQTVMADRIMHISGVTVRHAMIPMSKVIYAPANLNRAQMLDLMRAHNYSRFPQVDAAGQVVSILNIYDALAEGSAAAAKVSEPVMLPDSTTITDALYVMQRTHAPMAVVADATGKHVGIVTVKDLVEEIVGELEAW